MSRPEPDLLPGKWQRRRILIWGKTRPDLSATYREIVCTGGVFEDTRELVRLYPIPLLFMDEEKKFAKYNLIKADVMRNTSDPRPESFKIRFDTIAIEGNIATKKGGNWDKRADWVLAPGNDFGSVEQLQEQQAQDGTSLGLVKPGSITKVEWKVVGASDKAAYMEKYDQALRQLEIKDTVTGRDVKPLTPPDYRFFYTFSCEGRTCTHTMGVLDWEVDALYSRMKEKYDEARGAQEVVATLQKYVGAEYDLRFFLGNSKAHQHNFTIVGLWYPKRGAGGQASLSF